MNELRRAVDSYLSKLVAFFRGAFPNTAKRFHVLFVNSADGEFTFSPEPVVNEVGVVVTYDDYNQTVNMVQNSGSRAVVFDTRNDSLMIWENGGWTITTENRDDVFKVGRVYFSPYTQKLFLFDNTLNIEQIKGTTV